MICRTTWSLLGPAVTRQGATGETSAQPTLSLGCLMSNHANTTAPWQRRAIYQASGTAAVLASFGPGIAGAAAVNRPSAQINACSAKQIGVIYLPTGGTCTPKDRPVNWAQVGPQGPASPGAPQGHRGRPVRRGLPVRLV